MHAALTNTLTWGSVTNLDPATLARVPLVPISRLRLEGSEMATNAAGEAIPIRVGGQSKLAFGGLTAPGSAVSLSEKGQKEGEAADQERGRGVLGTEMTGEGRAGA